MKRSLLSAVALMALSAAAPAMAADFPELRPAYPENWENPDDSLRFEFGTRYWMSWGTQDAGFAAVVGGVPLGDVGISTGDQTHIGELHGKIEDLSTQTYVSGKAGIGLSTSGTYAITPASSGSIGPSSRVGYAGADFGWLPFGNMTDGFAVGGLVGYQYWKDAPDIGQGRYGTAFAGPGGAPSAFAPAQDDFDIHALRLGVKGQATFDMFDVQAEVAAIPYAHVSGTVGGSGSDPFVLAGFPFYERAPTTLSGRGYGVMAEGMVGFHPTENLTVRVGGRAWYLEGQLDAQFSSNVGGGDLPTLTLPSNFARIFRYGALLEVTGKF